jgi:hypothetical protein
VALATEDITWIGGAGSANARDFVFGGGGRYNVFGHRAENGNTFATLSNGFSGTAIQADFNGCTVTGYNPAVPTFQINCNAVLGLRNLQAISGSTPFTSSFITINSGVPSASVLVENSTIQGADPFYSFSNNTNQFFICGVNLMSQTGTITGSARQRWTRVGGLDVIDPGGTFKWQMADGGGPASLQDSSNNYLFSVGATGVVSIGNGAGLAFYEGPIQNNVQTTYLYNANTSNQFFIRDSINGRNNITIVQGTAGNSDTIFLDRITVNGSTGQGADLGDWQIAGVNQARISPTGGFTCTSVAVQAAGGGQTFATIGTDGNTRLFGGAGFRFSPITFGTDTWYVGTAGSSNSMTMQDTTNGRNIVTLFNGTAGNAQTIVQDQLAIHTASGQANWGFQVQNNGSTQIFGVANSGVAFFGGGPALQQSITGALSTVTDAAAKAVLTSIISALVAFGLVTNNTT